MSDENFDLSCDRLSSIVDGALHERLHWERTVGPVLARLVELTHSALADREEFELSEEGATRDVKRYVVKIHGNRIFAIQLTVVDGRAIVDAAQIERSRFLLKPAAPISADIGHVDEQWIAEALQSTFERVFRRPEACEPAENQAA